jgi:hypothetical protein
MAAWTTARLWWKRNQEEQWRAGVRAAMANRTAPPAPYYRDLLSLSASLIGEGRHEAAVIVAQMACEVLTEQTLTPLLRKGQARANFNLDDKDVRKLYIKLTHDAIDQAPFWPNYRPHVVRRHQVVHRGRRVTPTEAQESLSIATQLVDHVENVQRGLP